MLLTNCNLQRLKTLQNKKLILLPTMKISTIAATLLALSPVTQAVLYKEESLKTSKAQIVIQGVPNDFSKEDLAVINKSAIAAYNAVQKDSSYSLVTVKPLLHFGAGDSVSQCMLCPPDDDAFSLGEEKVLVADVQVRSKQCMLCPPDDDVVALEDSSNHKLFVESFCNLLATSGSENLAKAHHCSFSFLEKPGHKVAPLSLVNRGEAALGFLSVTGLLQELSTEDIAIVESSTLETFNQAFANIAGYSELASLHVKSAVETPKNHHGLTQCMLCPPDDDVMEVKSKQCMLCPPDDDTMKSAPAIKQCMLCPPDDEAFSSRAGYVGSVLMLDIEVAAPKTTSNGKVSQCMLCPPDDETVMVPAVKQCMLCPPDDDEVGAGMDLKTVAMAFSRALCSKLRNSGSPNLAYADDCALDFFYEHDVAVDQKTA